MKFALTQAQALLWMAASCWTPFRADKPRHGAGQPAVVTLSGAFVKEGFGGASSIARAASQARRSGPTAPDPQMNAPAVNPPVRVWKALLLYFTLLISAMIASWPEALGFLGILLFPMGLINVFPVGRHATSYLWLISAYGIHAAFLYGFAVYRQRPVFYLVAVAYAAVLTLNVVGCRQMVVEWKNSQPDQSLHVPGPP